MRCLWCNHTAQFVFLFERKSPASRKIMRSCVQHRPTPSPEIQEITEAQLLDLQRKDDPAVANNLNVAEELGYMVLSSENPPVRDMWLRSCKENNRTPVFIYSAKHSYQDSRVVWHPFLPTDFHGCTLKQCRGHIDLLYNELRKNKAQGASVTATPTGQMTISFKTLEQAHDWARAVMEVEKIIRDPDLFTVSMTHDT